MDENQKLITKFYSAFQQKDFLVMQSCYHNEAQFSDEVFPILNSKEVKGMWEMLLTSAKDLRIEFRNIRKSGQNVVYADWEAWYSFSRTGRPVHNKVRSYFAFRDGLILHQVDQFNFWRWSRQALGTTGTLLGWSPVVKNKVRTIARGSLDKFLVSGLGPTRN